ncbi:MAG: sortase [Clostridiales bacterium]|nr:sortase [Candidatus Apopatocola equi]
MKKGNAFILLGLLLIAAALALTGFNLWDNLRAGKAARDMLEQLEPLVCDDPVPPTGQSTGDSDSPDEIEYPDYVLNPWMDMPVKKINGESYVGIVSVPAISCELPVYSQWTYENMKNGPCRYTGTAYLDDMVICGHNNNMHFGGLRNLSQGDEVLFTDMDGNIFRYRVLEIETLEPEAITEMTTGDWDLTLFTCTYTGAARVTVRCAKS